jgi:hypothetical protein
MTTVVDWDEGDFLDVSRLDANCTIENSQKARQITASVAATPQVFCVSAVLSKFGLAAHSGPRQRRSDAPSC